MENISDEILETVVAMIDEKSDQEVIDWIESQKNAQDIFEWFNKFIQGYVAQPEEKK